MTHEHHTVPWKSHQIGAEVVKEVFFCSSTSRSCWKSALPGKRWVKMKNTPSLMRPCIPQTFIQWVAVHGSKCLTSNVAMLEMLPMGGCEYHHIGSGSKCVISKGRSGKTPPSQLRRLTPLHAPWEVWRRIWSSLSAPLWWVCKWERTGRMGEQVVVLDWATSSPLQWPLPHPISLGSEVAWNVQEGVIGTWQLLIILLGP